MADDVSIPDTLKFLLGDGPPPDDAPQRPAAVDETTPPPVADEPVTTAGVFKQIKQSKDPAIAQGLAKLKAANAGWEEPSFTAIPETPETPPPSGAPPPASQSRSAPEPGPPGQERDPAIESWMSKNPIEWWPRDAGERARWRKSLTNKELVEWEKLRKETTYWHLATRNGGAPAYTWGLPQYKDYRRRLKEFRARTVPKWRKLEQQYPPRLYRPRMSAVESLGGVELG